MSLEVLVLNAKNIPNVETFGKSDPYVQLVYQGIKKKTDVKKGELSPEWNEKLVFDLKGQPLQSHDEIELYIKDWELVGRNRVLGTVKIRLKDLVKPGAQKQLKLKLSLHDSNNRPTEATVFVTLTYRAPPGTQNAGDKEIGTEVSTYDEDEDDEEDQKYDDEEDEEDDIDIPDGDTTDHKSKKRKKKKKRRRMGGRKIRGNLSDKPQDFQIRIKIIEARQLPGANISPVSRVTCYNQTKQTRVQKSTNSPFFNEVFFFNFFSSPAELFDELVTFGIYNSRKLRSDAFIGSFKCDIGMIYDEPDHSFVNKWLLLSDPEDTMSGAKGYLKICATVLGPGDEAPSFKPQTQDDEEDIESNLLRPAGVMLRPATFKLRLFRAEDIPRMDNDFVEGMKQIFRSGEKKELVDPYFIFSFAGQDVRSKIVYNSENPEWNQELQLGLRFPSMCERIKFQMFDWDRVTQNDCVCSATLDTKFISCIGETDKGEDAILDDADESSQNICVSTNTKMYTDQGNLTPDAPLHKPRGFLPTFGPCFVNFYGSPREYSDLPDEYDDLNLGKGEGVAYRGRALVELQTILGEMPETQIDDLQQDDILRVQKFMRRRKYKLHAAFLNATMVTAVDAPIEFEVSIGNYGNKLDESVPPCSSTTQPTNAVFDGAYYYFLPWADTKPCVVVDSHWEDISFRLEALNLLLHIIERLEEHMERVRVGMKANLSAPELAKLMIALLNQLVDDCGKPLPPIVDGQHVQNDLDRHLRYYREVEMEHMCKDAKKLRESATDMNETFGEVEGYLAQLKNLAVEPQNSMPDVVIWMISGTKRVAYFRCPAYQLLWSANPDYRGKYCGHLETYSLKYPGNKAEKDNKWEIPALLRVKLWLGLEKHEMEWHQMQTEGELAVFAETYENQVTILGNWTNKGPTMTRPKFSDVTGKVEFMKEDFRPPPGWRWDGDWYISPELSMLFDKDAGHTQFMEDVYENHSRYPGGTWDVGTVPWTDVIGDSMTARDEIELPEGWEWEEDWQYDLNRAVDEYGWEYTVEATMGGYGPVEKTYHMCRRRRWLRSRILIKNLAKKKEEEKHELAASEGWEYAPLFNMKFHHKERKMDLVRRRRWHRKMVAESPNAPCFFQIQNKSQKKKDDESSDKYNAAQTAPRMFLICNKPKKWQLRAYIYQARDLLAGDSNGLSDPFARVVFLNQSDTTERLDKTLCPTWDQTLIFEQVSIHGNPEDIAVKPPEVVIEIFDYDTFGGAEFLGRTKVLPMVKLDSGDQRSAVLQWYPIKKGEQYGGEMLAAVELLLLAPEAGPDFTPIMMDGKDLPSLPPKRGKIFIVPNEIRPVMQRTAIEVMCWGVRNMAKFQLASVTSPSIEFEVGGHVVQSKVVRNTKKNPNFDEPLLFFDIMLPREELYTPPLNVKVRDNRQFGRKPMVGVHIIKTLEPFRCNPNMEDEHGLDQSSSVGNGDGVGGPGHTTAVGEHVIDMPFDEKTPILDTIGQSVSGESSKQYSTFPSDTVVPMGGAFQDDIDWWSKYYASTGTDDDKSKHYLEKQYDKIQVFPGELEKVGQYNEFDDFCHTFSLSRGKNVAEESETVGEFKGSFRIYPLPNDPSEPMPPRALRNLPTSAPEECIVRVYVIKAVELQPNDPTGLADPYVDIRLGKYKVNSRDTYLPNTLNPLFGKMFEFKAIIPLDKDLCIRIKDYDLLGTDDVIGETIIDLENRYLTKYRATCGLPQTYSVSGPNIWRDSKKPKDLLEDFCSKYNIHPGPIFTGNNCIKVGNRVYNLSDFEKPENQPDKKPTHNHLGSPEQRLALHVLITMPASMGLPLVPEHVETRPLYNPLQPGIEQGKLQMWVDLYPSSHGAPGPAVDISARQPKHYELRIIIWNTKDVILEEESITGEKMSDIYVKGWMSGLDDDKQETDVHYRSLDGEGNFNWRFVFPFDYIPAEERVFVKRKEHFWSLDETELKLRPKLLIQIWDNDKFSADDFLGTLELNLNNMPAPTRKSAHCNLDKLDISETGKNKTVSLFEQKRVRGYWPCYSDEDNEKKLTGKVEMEIELVDDSEVKDKPAGQGRSEPNQHPVLEPPKRPATSFLWFTSPWKTLKHIIWRNYKWYFITGIIILLIVIFVILFIYSMPGAVVSSIVG